MEIELLEARPGSFQRENWLLDSNYYWIKIGRIDWSSLQAFVQPHGPLWINGESSATGVNHRIRLQEANTLLSSLRLIHVNSLVIDVSCPRPAFGNQKRRLQAQFFHAETSYKLRVTDPVYERKFLALPDGRHELGESCLTVSLGEPFEGYVYKLVAAIIEKRQNP
jgi:hypothetical protein